eukprot:1195251-Prorocentrum_minimum.AAC.4
MLHITLPWGGGGRLGLLERENAAVLNACLCPMAARTAVSINDTLAALGLPGCALLLTQNDGTVAEVAPVSP